MGTAFANEIPKETNIHFAGKYCEECHSQTPEKGKDKYLKYGNDYGRTCRCHEYTPGTYIHPVFIKLSDEKKSKIPDNFPLDNGEITCLTCHDIYLQCQDRVVLKLFNRLFLRGGPYLQRTDICFNCHNRSEYAKLNPHNQLDEYGNIIGEKCLYCHTEKPDEKLDAYKETSSGHQVKLIGNFDALCLRCHPEKGRFHPINADHLRRPSAVTLSNIKEAEKKYNVILPLNDKGEITCATCHNPHEKGVLPRKKASASGASEKYRLRLSGMTGEICRACHKK
ncbi:MAG: hypothetical protein HY809_02760 [Nitrospirae bacterium]|nr:hypothetical protein [Nitrospirota bacterium]